MSYTFSPGRVAQSPHCGPNTITNHGSFMVPGHRLHPRPKPYPNCDLDRSMFPQGQHQGMPIAHRRCFQRAGGPRCVQPLGTSLFQQAMLNGQRQVPHPGFHLHGPVCGLSKKAMPLLSEPVSNLQGSVAHLPGRVHQPVLRSLLEAPVFETASSDVTYTPEYNMALAMVLINNHESRRQMMLQEMAGSAPASLPHPYSPSNNGRPEPATSIAPPPMPPHMLLKNGGPITQPESSSLPAFASNDSHAPGRITPPPLPPSILLKNHQHPEETSFSYSCGNNGKSSFTQGCRASRRRELKEERKDGSTRNGRRQLGSGVAMSTVQLERVLTCRQQFAGSSTREGTLWNDGSICEEESVTIKMRKTTLKTPAYDYGQNRRSGVGMTDEDSRYVHEGSMYGGGSWETSEADREDKRCGPGWQDGETGYRINCFKRKVPNVINSAEPCQKSPKIDTEWLVEDQAYNIPSLYGNLVLDEVQGPIDKQADVYNLATQMSSGHGTTSMCPRLPEMTHDNLVQSMRHDNNLVQSFSTERQEDETVAQAVDPYSWASRNSRTPSARVNSGSSESLYRNALPKVCKSQYSRDNQVSVVNNAKGFESSDTSQLSSVLHTEAEGGCKPEVIQGGEASSGGISHLKQTNGEDIPGYLEYSQGEDSFFKMFKSLNQKRIADMQRSMTTSNRASNVLDEDVPRALQTMPRARSDASQNALHGLPSYSRTASVVCTRKPEGSPRSMDVNAALKITVVRSSNSAERTSAQNEKRDMSRILTSPMTRRTHFTTSGQKAEVAKKMVHFAEETRTQCKFTKNGQIDAEKYRRSQKIRSLGDRFGMFMRVDEYLKSNESNARKDLLPLFEEPAVIPSQRYKSSVATTKASKTRDLPEINGSRKRHSELHVPKHSEIHVVNKKGRPAKGKRTVTFDIDDSDKHMSNDAVVKKKGRPKSSKNKSSISLGCELQKVSLDQQCSDIGKFHSEADESDPGVGSGILKREKLHGKKRQKGHSIDPSDDEVAPLNKKSKGNKKHVIKSKKSSTIPSHRKKKSVETGVIKKLEWPPGGKNKKHKTLVVVSPSDKKKSIETGVRKRIGRPPGNKNKKVTASDTMKAVETSVIKNLECPSGSKHKKARTSLVVSSPKNKKSSESCVRKTLGSKVQKRVAPVMVSPPAKNKSATKKMRAPSGHKDVISTDGKKAATKLKISVLNDSKLLQEKILTPLRVIVSRLSEKICKDRDRKISGLVKGEKGTKSPGKKKKRIDRVSNVLELDSSFEEKVSLSRPIVVVQKCKIDSTDSHEPGTKPISDGENRTSNMVVLADEHLEDNKFENIPITDDESTEGYASESSLSDTIPFMDQEHDLDESGIFTVQRDEHMKKLYDLRNELCIEGSADGSKARHRNVHSKEDEQREPGTNSFPARDFMLGSTDPEAEEASRNLEPSCRVIEKHVSKADDLSDVNCTETREEPSGRSDGNLKPQKALTTVHSEDYKYSVSCGNELSDEDEYFHKMKKRSHHQQFSKRNKKKDHDKKRNTNAAIDKGDQSKWHETDLNSHKKSNDKKKQLQSSGTDGGDTKQKHLQSADTQGRHGKKKSTSKHHRSHGSKAKGKGPSRSKSKALTEDTCSGSGKTPVPRITLHMIQGDQLTQPRLSLRTCVYCQTFSTRLAHMMREHVKVAHPYKCKSCHITFKEQVEMAAHKLTQHQMEVHHCTLCRQVFMTKYRLDQHMTSKCHQRLVDAQREAMNAICKAVHKNRQLYEDSFTDTLKTIGYQESALWNPGKKKRKALPAPGDVSTAPPPQCPNLSHLRHFYYDNPELKDVVRKFSNVYEAPEAAVAVGRSTSSVLSVNDSQEVFYFPFSDMEETDTWTVTQDSEEVSKVTSVENCTFTSVENHDMMDMNLCESLGAAISEWDNQLHLTEEFGQKADAKIETYPNESFFEEVMNYDSLNWDETQSGEIKDYQVLQPVKAETESTGMITDFLSKSSLYTDIADGSVELAAVESESLGPVDCLGLMDCSIGGSSSEVTRTDLVEDFSASSTLPMSNLCTGSNSVDDESDAGQSVLIEEGELKKESKESIQSIDAIKMVDSKQHLATANEQDDSLLCPTSSRLPLPLIIPISTEIKTERQSDMKCNELPKGIDINCGLSSETEAKLDLESGNALSCGEIVTGSDISNSTISSPKVALPLKFFSSVPCPANICDHAPVRLPMPANALRPSTHVLDIDEDVSRSNLVGGPGGDATQGSPERNPVLRCHAPPAVDGSTFTTSPMPVKQSPTKPRPSPLKRLNSVSCTKTSHATLTMCVPLLLNIPSPLPMKIYSSVLNKTENTTVRTVTNLTAPLPLKPFDHVDVRRRLSWGHQKGSENTSSLMHPDIISETVKASGIPGHFGMDSSTVLLESIPMSKLLQDFRPAEHQKMMSVCKPLMIDSSMRSQPLKLFTLEDFRKLIGCAATQTLAIGNSVQRESGVIIRHHPGPSDVLPEQLQDHHPGLSSTSSCGLLSGEEFSDHHCSGAASGGAASRQTVSVGTESSQSCVSQGDGDVSEEGARTLRRASSDSDDSVSDVGVRRCPESHGVWESDDSVSNVGMKKLQESCVIESDDNVSDVGMKRLAEYHGVWESDNNVSGVGVRNLTENHLQIQMDLLLREIAEGEAETFPERN